MAIWVGSSWKEGESSDDYNTPSDNKINKDLSDKAKCVEISQNALNVLSFYLEKFKRDRQRLKNALDEGNTVLTARHSSTSFCEDRKLILKSYRDKMKLELKALNEIILLIESNVENLDVY